MKLIIKLIITLMLFVPFYTNATNINPLAENWFKTFSAKIQTKYNTDEEISYFKWFNEKLEELKIKKNLNESQTNLVNDLIILSNELIFETQLNEEENENKRILDRYSFLNNFRYKSLNKNHIFLKDWIRYTYIFDNHLYFDVTNDKLNISTLNANWIYSSKSVVYIKDDWKLWFLTDYKIRKLITDDIIKGVSWKYNFLKELRDDKKKLNYETDAVFQQLKDLSIKLTNWKNKDDKIKSIYEYVIKHVEYEEDFTFEEANFFSWIHTYATWRWVCEWYVKMFLYMLNFSGIDDVQAIRWYVLDASDFPEIGHAWISIWDHYYDPTFDDPIGQTKTKEFSEYKYYNLPYDLFYTNRYTFEKLPSFLKTKSLEYRKAFINKRIAALLPKYKYSWYNLLKPFLFKYNNNLEIDKDLTIEWLSKVIWIYNVNNWSFYINWVKKYISNINYYSVADSNLETVVSQLDYNLDWVYLFKWTLDDWKYEYRLAYNVEFN